MKATVNQNILDMLKYVGYGREIETIGADVHLEMNSPEMLGNFASECGGWGIDFTVHFHKALAMVTIPFGAKLTKS